MYPLPCVPILQPYVHAYGMYMPTYYQGMDGWITSKARDDLLLSMVRKPFVSRNGDGHNAALVVSWALVVPGLKVVMLPAGTLSLAKQYSDSVTRGVRGQGALPASRPMVRTSPAKVSLLQPVSGGCYSWLQQRLRPT